MGKIPEEFVRHLRVEEKEGDVTITAQPYCVGMYSVITFPDKSYQQNSHTHGGYYHWMRKLIKKLESQGKKVTVTRAKFTDFLSQNEVDEYIMK